MIKLASGQAPSYFGNAIFLASYSASLDLISIREGRPLEREI